MPEDHPHPLTRLSKEDLDLVAQLVLQGGSLKELAAAYGVSYPTIRGRLDRVIQRLRAIDQGSTLEPMNSLLSTLLERGEISFGAARSIRELARALPAPTSPTLPVHGPNSSP